MGEDGTSTHREWWLYARATGPFGPTEGLRLRAEIVAARPSQYDDWYACDLQASYGDVVVVASWQVRAPRPDPSPETYAQYRAREDEMLRQHAWSVALRYDPDTLLRLGGLTHRDFGRLGSPRWHGRLEEIQRRVRPLLDEEPIPAGPPPECKTPQEIRDALLTAEAMRRADRAADRAADPDGLSPADRRVADRIASLPLVEPAPGWEERAVDRARDTGLLDRPAGSDC